MRPVADDGPRSARIVGIGEAPASVEVALGKPFVGPAGMRASEWWRGVGIDRKTDLYLMNVYPFQAPKNKIESVPAAEREEWARRLPERLTVLDDPYVLVPMGNYALDALLHKAKITKRRGSIYTYQLNGRDVKVIPTIHPAATFRTPSWQRRCRRDWARIVADAQFREARLPAREHFIRPTLEDCRWYLKEAERCAECLALDVETPREARWEPRVLKSGKSGKPKRVLGEARITCVGFSYTPSFSITIPTTLEYWRSKARLAQAWQVIRQLCALPCEKAGQFFRFDAWWLTRAGIDLVNPAWDTYDLHHALDPLEEHSLHYMASVDTREPYWKDEAKDPDEAAKWATDLDAFWVYNGKDVAVSRELVDTYFGEANRRNLVQFYSDHYLALWQPLLRIMLHGVALNEPRRATRFAALTVACLKLQARLSEMAGEPIYAKKDLSSAALKRYLYGTLRLPERRDRATGKVTVKEVAVRRLMLAYPKKAPLQEAGQLILDHRRTKKLSEFYAPTTPDDDGRIRCTYGWTDMGRLSSSKAPNRRGRNTQNIDRASRDVYVPDAGCILLEIDGSQVEDRVVKTKTGEPRLILRARMRPWENDEHTRAAAVCFRAPETQVTKDQRYLGKRTRHATNFGEQGRTHADNLLKDGYVYTVEECQAMIEALHGADPEIRDWQRRVRQVILRDRVLVNSWGRRFDVRDERLDDDLYRRGYAFEAQSECADWLNQWGVRPFAEYVEAAGSAARINVHGHDSLLISVPPAEAWSLAQLLKRSLERPRAYRVTGRDETAELRIWTEVKLGRTWTMDQEYKQWPTRKAFEEVAYGLARG